MSRSLKKGPYINLKLEKKVLAMNESGKKVVIKTWARASMISLTSSVIRLPYNNGNKFIPVFITENMVGHKLGEFSPRVPSVVTAVIRRSNSAGSNSDL